jgi:hypothetical protein
MVGNTPPFWRGFYLVILEIIMQEGRFIYSLEFYVTGIQASV